MSDNTHENKALREIKEMKSLFDNPKFQRSAWRAVGTAILCSPAQRSESTYNSEGEIDLRSSIESYSYNKLYKDIRSLGQDDREPTELELILQCQIVKARYDTSAAIFVRDTLGARPIDESKIEQTNHNLYEDMSDKELEMLQQFRIAQKAIDDNDDNDDNDNNIDNK